MKRHLFHACCVLSLLLAVVVCVGYVGYVSISFLDNPPGATAARCVDIRSSEGRVACYFERVTAPFPPGTPTGRHLMPHFGLWPMRAPSLRRSTWEFDAHWLAITPPPVAKVFLLAFPIWCAWILL